jgi:hypothetical protein
MQITEQRKKRVIDLYFNQHKTYAEIAHIERISPRDIHAIIKEEEARRQKYEHQQHQEEMSSKAYKLFSKGKRPVQVAIELNQGQPQVTKLYIDYWKLKRLHILKSIYKETNGKLRPFLKLYRLMKEKGMSIEQVVNAVDTTIHKLPYIENLYEQVKDQVENMQRTIQRLANGIMALEYKISILDKIAFSCEQDCRRKHQEIQELTDKKDRIEKWITNVLNGEDYSKFKQIVKENGKAVLSENKKLISISFTALIQTIKADPQMIKLIQNMPSAKDSEQYKDDNNNITKYLELNRDRILNFAEKNYKNLVEALATNAIDAVGASSLSNPTLSLPQSSSPTFPDLSTQSYIFRIEESDTHHNSTGDITE